MSIIHNLARRGQLLIILTAFAVTLTFAQAGQKSCCQFVSVPIRIEAAGQLSKYWAISHFELREAPDDTWGYVKVQNLADSAVAEARFYGEYFDAKGRFCFSLAFSLSSNEEHLNTPVQPGGIRTLRSLAGFLTPAVAPAKLRLYLVGQRMTKGRSIPGGGPSVMRAPPVISIPGGGPPSLSTLLLDPDQVPPDDAIRNLVLARVRFRSDGQVENYKIIRSMSGRLSQWLHAFLLAARSPVSPGGGGFLGVKDALVFVRAVASYSATVNPKFLPRRSSWVSRYVVTVRGAEIPPVIVVPFTPAPTRVKSLGSNTWHQVIPSPAPGQFSLLGGWTEWCPRIFEYKPRTVHGHLQRGWRRP